MDRLPLRGDHSVGVRTVDLQEDVPTLGPSTDTAVSHREFVAEDDTVAAAAADHRPRGEEALGTEFLADAREHDTLPADTLGADGDD